MELKFRMWSPIVGKYFHHVDAIECLIQQLRHGCDECLPAHRVSHDHQKDGMVFEQSIGLKDKSGNAIFVGDIIKHGIFALNDTVNFGPEPWNNLPDGVADDDITITAAVFAVEYDIQTITYISSLITRNPDVEGVEIIGNIHQNKELLDEHR